MRIGPLVFQPTLIPSLLTLALLPLLLGLGFWQLQRAEVKATLQAGFEARENAPYAGIAQIDPADPDTRYQKVTAPGRYDSGHQILLDNQIQDGRAGYHVFTPLRPAGQPWAILVNRGWVPLGESRQRLPEVPAPDGEVTVRGRLSQPANPGLRLGEPAPADWPRVVQYLDYPQVADALGYRLAPAVILLDPDLAGGYRRDWRPTFGGIGPERHRGYAVQWFSLAAALVIIYLAVNTHRPRAEDA